MTTIVIMSDIHGNLPALEAVQRSLPDHDAVYVAGDLCLDGPQPAEVVDCIVERGWHAVMGNTDRDIVTPPPPGSKESDRIAWTREQLGPERLAWLAALPFSLDVSCGSRKLLVAHANPRDMETQLRLEMSDDDLRPFLEDVDAEIVAFGHWHVPYVRPVDGRVLIDVSSAGHPKDGDRRPAYTVLRLEGERRSIESVRIPYDIDETVRRLRASGIPRADGAAASLLKASY